MYKHQTMVCASLIRDKSELTADRLLRYGHAQEGPSANHLGGLDFSS
jgi:hypothetical protein